MKLERAFVLSTPLRLMPVALRYAMATSVVLLFFAIRVLFGALMGGYPFLLFFPAIILISVLFDCGTGVYAVVLSAVIAWFFFIPKLNSFEMTDWSAALPLALYVVIGLFVAVLIEMLRSTAERLAQTAAKLEQSNSLNQLLLVDVNHRVKNHLASVSGLLRLSLRDLKDPQARQAIENAVDRINVLGEVYARLHLGERATVVSSREFITSLCEGLRSAVTGLRPIALRVHVDDIALSSTQAVPLGLVINELVENALKYAFPDERPGDICVGFEAQGEQLTLTVRDDGIGFDTQSAHVGGGTRIVRSLVQQMGGKLEVRGAPGSETTVRLPREAPAR